MSLIDDALTQSSLRLLHTLPVEAGVDSHAVVVLGALAHQTPGIGVKQVSLWVEGVPWSLGTLGSKDILDASLQSVIPCSPNATIRLFEIYLVEGLGGVLGIENVKLYGARGS